MKDSWKGFNNEALEALRQVFEKYYPDIIIDLCDDGSGNNGQLGIKFKFIDNFGKGEWSTGRLYFLENEEMPSMVVDARPHEELEKMKADFGPYSMSLNIPCWG